MEGAAVKSMTAASLSDDTALVALIHDQPMVGLAQLYDRFGRVVYSVAFRVVQDHGTAEEITQDVFLRCWRSIDRYQPTRGSFAAWLLTITQRRAIDELRSRRGREWRQTVPDDQLLLIDAGCPPLDAALIREDVQEALDNLPAAQREVIELVFWAGLTRKEVADQLHIPIGTVHSRLRLGMDRLRELLRYVFDDE